MRQGEKEKKKKGLSLKMTRFSLREYPRSKSNGIYRKGVGLPSAKEQQREG